MVKVFLELKVEIFIEKLTASKLFLPTKLNEADGNVFEQNKVIKISP